LSYCSKLEVFRMASQLIPVKYHLCHWSINISQLVSAALGNDK